MKTVMIEQQTIKPRQIKTTQINFFNDTIDTFEQFSLTTLTTLFFF